MVGAGANSTLSLPPALLQGKRRRRAALAMLHRLFHGDVGGDRRQQLHALPQSGGQLFRRPHVGRRRRRDGRRLRAAARPAPRACAAGAVRTSWRGAGGCADGRKRRAWRPAVRLARDQRWRTAATAPAWPRRDCGRRLHVASLRGLRAVGTGTRSGASRTGRNASAITPANATDDIHADTRLNVLSTEAIDAMLTCWSITAEKLCVFPCRSHRQRARRKWDCILSRQA